MKTKAPSSIYIIITAIFTFLYIFLAAKPLNKEYHFTPEWLVSTANPSIKENSDNKDLIYFKLGKSLGYFTENGDITLYKAFPEKASISNEYYSIYSTTAGETKIYNSLGKETGKFVNSGFPFFIGKNIYNFLPGGASFSMCSETGETLWTYEGIMPITAFNSEDNFTVAGFVDGTIKIFKNEDGTLLNAYSPGGSDFSAILGIDVSSDGKYIASISGHDKQRFIISEINSDHPRIIFHKYLTNDTKVRTLVHFCNNQKKVVYVCENTINIYDMKKNKNYKIPIDSRIIDIAETENQIFLLGKKGTVNSIYILEKTNILEGKFSFEAENSFIRTKDNSLYVGKDNTISKILITRD